MRSSSKNVKNPQSSRYSVNSSYMQPGKFGEMSERVSMKNGMIGHDYEQDNDDNYSCGIYNGEGTGGNNSGLGGRHS